MRRSVTKTELRSAPFNHLKSPVFCESELSSNLHVILNLICFLLHETHWLDHKHRTLQILGLNESLWNVLVHQEFFFLFSTWMFVSWIWSAVVTLTLYRRLHLLLFFTFSFTLNFILSVVCSSCFSLPVTFHCSCWRNVLNVSTVSRVPLTLKTSHSSITSAAQNTTDENLCFVTKYKVFYFILFSYSEGVRLEWGMKTSSSSIIESWLFNSNI